MAAVGERRYPRLVACSECQAKVAVMVLGHVHLKRPHTLKRVAMQLDWRVPIVVSYWLFRLGKPRSLALSDAMTPAEVRRLLNAMGLTAIIEGEHDET